MAVTFNTVKKKEAQEALSDLRTGRGGRTSEWEPLVDAFGDLKKNDSITFETDAKGKNAARGLLYRRVGKENVDVKTSRMDKDGKKYFVVVSKPD